MDTSPRVVSRWTGIPFRWGGSSFRGADCCGLVFLYLQEELGVKLPPEGGPRTAAAWKDGGERRMLEYLDRHCVRVEHPRRGDIVVIHGIGQAAHAGVMVDERRFLHTNFDRTSEIGWLDAYPKHRVLGFWRPRSVME